MSSLRIRSVVLALATTCVACGGDDDGSGADDAGAPADGDITPADMTVEPDLGPPESCSEEAAMRPAPCGNCGMTQERCEGGFWTAGECLAEGECAPGALEERNYLECGTEARLCTDECTWLEWTLTDDPTGECIPGSERMAQGSCEAGSIEPQTCTDACEWESAGACDSLCGPLRTSPANSEELCVPEGMFIRGDDMQEESASAEVFVSTFVIDRYPVTNRRFLECRAAGRCTQAVYADEALNDPARADHFVLGVREEAANDFCDWDGGRRLPTEAEWEKAMRGPAPRAYVYPWGNTMDCTMAIWAEGCPDAMTYETIPFRAFHSMPHLVSYYGAEDMIHQGGEMVKDFWDANYFSDPGSLDDPQGPTSGFSQVIKSTKYAGWLGHRISYRTFGGINQYGPTFRCARNVE